MLVRSITRNTFFFGYCFLTVTCFAKELETNVYQATISEIDGAFSSISGTVTVFAPQNEPYLGYVGYGGFLMNAPSNLDKDNCTATNGCGVHIHSGNSCANSDAEGGHYYVDPVSSDPWGEEKYSSDMMGSGTFSSLVFIGGDDVEGRAFIVHAEDGSRIGCGILEKVSSSNVMRSDMKSLGDSQARGEVDVYQVGSSDQICFYGIGSELEANLDSTNSIDCTATNGCGAHIHSGSSCKTTTTEGGHFYDTDTILSDPWAQLIYTSTNNDGGTQYMNCLATGKVDYRNKLFILHANDGSRVACGKIGAGGSVKTFGIFGLALISFIAGIGFIWFRRSKKSKSRISLPVPDGDMEIL